MATVDVKDLAGQVVGSLTLPEPAVTARVQTPLVWEAVKAYLANHRQGTASTKTRGQVRGGGRKPWRQKGTGRARAGTIRSPLWRGGGVVFGPHPRDYRVRLPRAMRRTALRASLEAKWREGTVTVVRAFAVEPPKTQMVARALDALHVTGRALILVERPDARLARAARNLVGVTVKPAQEATAYDVLAHRHLVVSEAAWQQLQAPREASG